MRTILQKIKKELRETIEVLLFGYHLKYLFPKRRKKNNKRRYGKRYFLNPKQKARRKRILIERFGEVCRHCGTRENL